MIHERLERVRQMLAENPRCPISRLQKELGVSRSTVRRDLLRLEEEGALLRVHGGALHTRVLRAEPTFDSRATEAVRAKRAIADAAVALVGPGETVFVDAGTTCLETGVRLLQRPGIRIYTHSVRLLTQAGGAAAEVICLGGTLRAAGEALVGGLALSWLNALQFDRAFLGASGLDVSRGAGTTELSEAAIKQQVLARSASAVLLADTGKLQRRAAVTFAGWDHLEIWMTERLPEAAVLDAVQAGGCRVMLAVRE